jgi:hypothetical protein
MVRTYLHPRAIFLIDVLSKWMENDSRPAIVERSLEHTYKILLRWQTRKQRRQYERVTGLSSRGTRIMGVSHCK